MTGGYWGYNTTVFANYSAAISAVAARNMTQPSAFLLAAKFLWRQGFVRCPETCGEATPAAECKCSCPAAVVANRTADELLELAGAFALDARRARGPRG